MALTDGEQTSGPAPVVKRLEAAADAEDVAERRHPPSAVLAPLFVTLVVATVRAWTSRRRLMYGITPDEPGQLSIARFVSGLPRWNMFEHSTWRPLYGTLIAPLHWFIDDPTLFYEATHIVNAVLGGLAAYLSYLLARRLTGLSPSWCAVIALTVSLAPAILFTTNYSWAESLVAVVYSGALLALLRFYDQPSVGRGVLLAALSIAGYITHTRLLPLALVSAGVVAYCVARRRLTIGAGAVVLATFAALYLAGSWYSELLVDRIWEAPSARATPTAACSTSSSTSARCSSRWWARSGTSS